MPLTYPTLAEIVQKVVLRVGMVNGVGVQVYADDIIAEMVIHKFDLLFDKFPFPEYVTDYVGTLGSDGKCVADLTDTGVTGLLRYKDIMNVWYESNKNPLKRFPNTRNASNYATAGGFPQYIQPTNDSKVFRVLPLGSSGDTVTVQHKQYPEEIIAGTEIKVDAQALILGAAYDYLSDEDSNAASVEKLQRMFNQRIDQLTADFSNQEVDDPRGGRGAYNDASGYQTIR